MRSARFRRSRTGSRAGSCTRVSLIGPAPPPQIVYVENYGPGRTDADIVADQKKASEERRKAEEARRQEFQKLEKKFGIE